jgi:hypothetical protein
MTTNPYQSPAAIDVEAEPELPTSLSVRRLISDTAAGMLVGATYGSLGGGCISALRVLVFGLPVSAYMRVEQTVMASVFGAFLGALFGALVGAVIGLVMGLLFRLLRLENSVGFYWGGVTMGAVSGSLAGFGGGYLMAQLAFSDPSAMVWYPIGAVVGGMIGAMAGRQWIRIAAGNHVSPFAL